jgi:hypothetical protein
MIHFHAEPHTMTRIDINFTAVGEGLGRKVAHVLRIVGVDADQA